MKAGEIHLLGHTAPFHRPTSHARPVAAMWPSPESPYHCGKFPGWHKAFHFYLNLGTDSLPNGKFGFDYSHVRKNCGLAKGAAQMISINQRIEMSYLQIINCLTDEATWGVGGGVGIRAEYCLQHWKMLSTKGVVENEDGEEPSFEVGATRSLGSGHWL